jgi:serine/threonine-protein kinase RsbW
VSQLGEGKRGRISVDLQLESSLESVEQAESIARDAARDRGFDEDEIDRLGLAVHECVVNAVVHGNRYNKQKRVGLSVEQREDGVRIVITDQGEGFDFESLPDPLAEENLLKNSGRGWLLIRAFVDEVEVKPAHPQGTQVTLVKYLERK